MKKKLAVLILAIFICSFSGLGLVNASPQDEDGPQHHSDNHHDQKWQHNHDKQWGDHEREWKEHDREWKEHDGDRDWQERHAHEWKDWYRWHHDNGDEGFDDFLLGVVVGAIMSGEN